MDKVRITKFEPGTAYSTKEQTIILNVFKYLCAQNLDKTASEIAELTSKATGCSVENVVQFREEEAMRHGFRACTSGRNVGYWYDETVKEAIRKIIFVLKTKNNHRISAKMILKLLEVNPYFPKLSLNALKIALADMGYVHDGSVYVHSDDLPTPGRVKRKRVNRIKPQIESESDDNTKTDGMENGAVDENSATSPVLKKKRRSKRVERIYPQTEAQNDNNKIEIMENVPNETVGGFVHVDSGDPLAVSPPVVKKKRRSKRLERIYSQIESQSASTENGIDVPNETDTPLESEIKIEESILDENCIYETEDVAIKTELEIKTEDSPRES
ncbi:hypothetical protein TcasGA2_TC008180 [Tribolium castaneum]|uniref:Uncharacterized protein n=1 Tax=Tribolium castaneum TaxID=7070 RepID=D2A087_TRICA|nr:hypothetical protein TcasGA2_TC008180 [Tribolium castaneum]